MHNRPTPGECSQGHLAPLTWRRHSPPQGYADPVANSIFLCSVSVSSCASLGIGRESTIPRNVCLIQSVLPVKCSETQRIVSLIPHSHLPFFFMVRPKSLSRTQGQRGHIGSVHRLVVCSLDIRQEQRHFWEWLQPRCAYSVRGIILGNSYVCIPLLCFLEVCDCVPRSHLKRDSALQQPVAAFPMFFLKTQINPLP